MKKKQKEKTKKKKQHNNKNNNKNNNNNKKKKKQYTKTKKTETNNNNNNNIDKKKKMAKACAGPTSFARGKAFSLHNVSRVISRMCLVCTMPEITVFTHLVLCKDSDNRRGESACNA